MKTIFLIIFTFTCCSVSGIENLPSSKINPKLLSGNWNAKWIAFPNESGLEYGVYHFRKVFSLAEKPEEFVVNVSADNRYRLFVNGQAVCFGPARGDLLHWNFETIDIAPFLKKGENTLAALVWNFADQKPWAQFSLRTGFILQGNSEKETIVNTNNSWKVIRDEAYLPQEVDRNELNTFIVVGPGDNVDAAKFPWGWELPGFDDKNWVRASEITNGKPKEAGTDINWGLQPRQIPLPEAKLQRLNKVRRTAGADVPNGFISGKESFTIKPNQKVVVLFDQGHLTTAYPELVVSGGKGSTLKLIYSEALFDKNRQKGNRNEIEGKSILGYSDCFLPDGGLNRMFRPLWFRTWRYLQVEINTKDEPLTVNDLRSEYTGYPFTENASFTSDDPQLSEIWEVGWRTARLCAGETYYDCPYYEQMQYVGDTRIQALISLYVSGDDRLMRQAIKAYDESRFSDGLTMSRYPSSTPQVIPTYSLFWADMVYDYWQHRDDAAFVKSMFQGIENVLHFFIQRIDPATGLIGKTGYWNFVDWAVEWPWNNTNQVGGVPEGGVDGQSSVITLQVAYSARHAAEMFVWAGEKEKAEYYRKIADGLIKSVRDNCWDNKHGYFASTPKKSEFAMHTQIFAVLTDAIEPNRQKQFVSDFMTDRSLIQPTMYFRFYMTQALKKAGLADKYLQTLDLWREMLDKGLTTFAEKPDPTRSDCHAWSASPNYDFLATVAGIVPAEPGFKSVRIEPHLGKLRFIKGQMPHPLGMIYFNLDRNGEKGLKGSITLPKGLTGSFIWNGQKVGLRNTVEIDL